MVDLVEEEEKHYWIGAKRGSQLTEESRLKVEEEDNLWVKYRDYIYKVEEATIKREYDE